MTKRFVALFLSSAVVGCSVDDRQPQFAVPFQIVPGSDGPAAAGAGGPSGAPVVGGSGGSSGPTRTGQGGASTGVPTRLAIHDLPSSGLVGTALPRFTVTLEDEGGNLVSDDGETISLTLEDGPSDARWVGFPTALVRDGVATFDAVSLDRPGIYRLAAVGLSLKAETSASLSVTAPAFLNVATNIPPQPTYSILAATPDLLYASTRQGIFRSENAGTSWTLASFGIPAGVARLRGSAARPGTLFAIAGDETQAGIDFIGRTSNRGETWRPLLAPAFDTGPMLDVAFDTRSPDVVWGCGASGVYRSDDAGDHWLATAFDGACGAIVYGGPTPGALYAYRDEGPTGALLKSETSGASWQTLRSLDDEPTGLFASASGILFLASGSELQRSDDAGATWSSAPVDVKHLVSSPADPTRMYAFTAQRVRVSIDAGATFDEGADMRPWTPNDLAVDPTDALRVYAATSGGLFVSTDGGVNWAPPSTGLAAASELVFDPSVPGRLWAAGRLLYQSEDSGDSWTLRDNGPASLDHMAFHPDDASLAYACGFDFYQSSDGGQAWTPLATTRSCNTLAVAGSTLWIGNIDGVSRSVDGGTSWLPTALDQPTYSLVADPAGNVLYAVTNTGAYRSSDTGDSWVPMLTTPRLEALAMDPARASRVWAASCDSAAGGPLRLSVNSGDTWSAPAGLPAVETFYCAYDVTFGSAGGLYALGTQLLYVSRDQGTSWEGTTTSGVAWFVDRKLAVSPDETQVFVATDLGLFRSVSGGP